MIVNPGIRRFLGSAIQRLFNSASFYATLTHSLVPERGTGSPTLTRASTATFRDWEGVLRTVPSGCARFEGARMVRNLLPSTEGAFNAGAGWTILNGTVTSGVTDPNGGTTAYTLKQTGVASCELYPTTPFSGIVLSSLWIRRRVGSGTISLYSGDSSENITSQVTSEWQRIQGTLPGTSAVVGFDIRLFTQDDEIDIWHPQAEDVTGQTTQTASEYVSVGVESAPYHGAGVDGVEFFSTDRDGAVIPAATNTGYLAETADVLAYPTASNILAAASTVYLEFTPDHTPSGTIALWGTYVDASNYTAILHDATNMIMRKRIAGMNYDATIANAFTANTTYKVCGSWGASGVTVTVDGTEGTPDANTTAAQIAATMQWGADGNSLQQPFATERNARVWQRQLSASERGAITA